MAPGLQKHRRAILIGVFGLFLAAGETQALVFSGRFWTGQCSLSTALASAYFDLWPGLVAGYLGVSGLITILTLRHGEPLDRRPTRAAMTGVSLIWLAAYVLSGGGIGCALASAIAGGLFLVFALIDWAQLFALLRSKTLVEHRDGTAASLAPSIVSDMKTPVALYAPATAAYRDNAKGEPIVAVPVDRMAAQQKLFSQVMIAMACAFFALPGGLFMTARHPHCPTTSIAKPWLDILGTTWRGNIDDGSVKYPFTLQIEEANDGHFHGYMDWGDVVANVDGTYEGDTLIFYDRSIRRGSSANFTLNDRKYVRVENDRMTGTDKNGRAQFFATRIR